MQNSLYTACDSCAEVLEGKKGTAQMRKNYLSIKGSVCLYVYNTEIERYDFHYGQPKDTTESLHFCNGACFDSYMEAKKVIHQSFKSSKSIW